MNTKAFFPCGGGSNLILGIGRENQIFFLRTTTAVKFFPQNCFKKMTFLCKKKLFFPCGGVSNLILGIGRK